MIYKYLRRHYIQSKSVVVICDETFQSFYWKMLATQIALRLLNSLKPEDHFGRISLARSVDSNIMRLEEKRMNLHVKESLIQDALNPGKQILSKKKGKTKTEGALRKHQLEQALFIATEWQKLQGAQ